MTDGAGRLIATRALRHATAALAMSGLLALSCVSSGAQAGGMGGGAALPGALAAVQRPAKFPSQWDAANWDARTAALAGRGFTEVRLQPVFASLPRSVEVPSGTWCQLVEGELDGKRQKLMFNISGDFGVSRDGTLHCLKIEMPTIGNKTAEISGPPPNCGGGAVRDVQPRSSLYPIPAGVRVGEMVTLSVPSYNVAHQYSESCAPLP